MTDFYVAADGDDAAQGTRQQPFATLTRARDAARALKGKKGRRIIVRGGTYYDVQLTIEPKDSGLTIEAAPGERPILYGGRRVAGWQRDGDFVAADLEGDADFRMLLVNGHWRPRARLPREGRFEHLDEFNVRWMSTTGGGWERKPTDDELTTMTYRPADLGPWLDVKSAEVTVFHQWDESLVAVESLDEKTHTMKFATPATHPPGGFATAETGAGKTYVVWNVREGMHEPGQWYLDRAAGRVVYWPMPDEDVADAEVIAPTTECIIRVAGTEKKPVTGVTLSGLALAGTTVPAVTGGFGAGKPDGAVTAEHTRDARFVDLSVSSVAGQGIKIQHSPGARVEGCEVHDTGACGVRAQGEGAEVLGCHVHHVGVLFSSAIGVQSGGGGVRIADCHIHHTPYSAVCAGGGTGSVFESNVFHNVMEVLHDGAAIYVTFCKDYALRGNVTRGIPSSAAAHAYYLDEQAEGCVVEDNVAVGCYWPSHNHMARRNTIRNNVFVHDGDMQLTFMKCEEFTFAGNVLRASGRILMRQFDAITSMPDNVFASATGRVEAERGKDYKPGEVEPLQPRDGSIIVGNE